MLKNSKQTICLLKPSWWRNKEDTKKKRRKHGWLARETEDRERHLHENRGGAVAKERQ